MFMHGFPPEWSTIKKLIWLKGAGIIGAAAAIWKTVSGSLIHITDALASPMRKCEVTLEPIQAGSGDPSPDNVRPITGRTGCEVTRTGKNILPNNYSAYSIDAAYAFIPSIMPKNVNAIMSFKDKDTSIDVSNCSIGFVLERGPNESVADVRWCMQNGSVKTITTNNSGNHPNILCNGIIIYPRSEEAFNKIFARWDIQVEYGNTITDYESPNITTLSVTFPALGKNLWDEQWEVSGSAIQSKNPIPCEAGQWYYISASPSNGWKFYDENGNVLATHYNSNKQAPDGAVSMSFKLGSAYGTTYNNDVIVAKTTDGSTSVPYEPYTNTVYGGTLDVVSGVLTVVKYFVDKTKWAQYASSNGYKAYRMDNLPRGRYRSDSQNEPMSNMISEFGSFSSGSMSKNIIQPPRDNSVSAFMALQEDIDAKTVELCYLIEPIEIQLTPQEISTLAGENNVWSNGDSVEITYKAQA